MFSHAAEAFVEVAGSDRVTFIPFALADWDGYLHQVATAFDGLGIEVESAHNASSPRDAILNADVVLMGGGNTFRLLDTLQKLDLIVPLAQHVREGRTRYMGASAGTNVACATIRTTNDMPIVHPATSVALWLLPFQINLHYVDADPDSTFMGETRDERIEEFLEENDCSVLAMYEGSWLRVDGEAATVTGRSRLFQRGRNAAMPDGGDVSHLLHSIPSFDDGIRPQR